MCGFCGIVYTNKERIAEKDILESMNRSQRHRGPDDEGYYFNKNIGLGHRRLSIIDLKKGKQPIFNEDGTIVVVFNGEIYNFPELKDELISKGHSFRTKTDTEVLPHLFEEYGDEFVKRLNGMFSFAIFNANDKTIILVRDRLGIKPLHYYIDEKMFLFGSEIKSIIDHPQLERAIDMQALEDYMTYEYVIPPRTMFEGIKKLSPGHFAKYEDGKLNIKKYWEIDYRDEYKNLNVQEYEEALVNLMKKSVKRRLISDVPLGAFLSGGIDSSFIVAMMSEISNRRVKTFSIGFDDETYNETEYARIISKKFDTEHHELLMTPDAVEMVDKLLEFLDEPFGDVSAIPTYLVSKLARENVTIALSGDGGDELFAGYERYIAQKMEKKYNRIPKFVRSQFVERMINKIPPTERKKGFTNIIKRFVQGFELPDEIKQLRWQTFLSNEQRDQIFSNDVLNTLKNSDTHKKVKELFKQVEKNDDLYQQLFVDTKLYLPEDILTKLDRMSMAVSLESRVPFLDHEFVEFVFSIPSNLKLNRTTTKYILKKSLKKMLPEKIINRKKEGFSIPVKYWICNELKDMMLDLLARNRIEKEGIFNPNYVEKLVSEHLNNTHNHAHNLWCMMIFELWSNKYIGKK